MPERTNFPYLCRANYGKDMLVVIEGLDGAGKSTQVKKLKKYLESIFGTIEYIHFPRYDALYMEDLSAGSSRGNSGTSAPYTLSLWLFFSQKTDMRQLRK